MKFGMRTSRVRGGRYGCCAYINANAQWNNGHIISHILYEHTHKRQWLGTPPNSQAACIGASLVPKSKEKSGLISVAIALRQEHPIAGVPSASRLNVRSQSLARWPMIARGSFFRVYKYLYDLAMLV